MVKGKNADKQSSGDATSKGSHPTVQRQLPRTAKQKHEAAEQERLRNIKKSTATLVKEAIRVGDTPTRLQDKAARGEITMREANIMRIAERDRIAKLVVVPGIPGLRAVPRHDPPDPSAYSTLTSLHTAS